MTLSTEILIMLVGTGLGIAALAFFIVAARRRKARKPAVSPDPDLDQTCELNYTPE